MSVPRQSRYRISSSATASPIASGGGCYPPADFSKSTFSPPRVPKFLNPSADNSIPPWPQSPPHYPCKCFSNRSITNVSTTGSSTGNNNYMYFREFDTHTGGGGSGSATLKRKVRLLGYLGNTVTFGIIRRLVKTIIGFKLGLIFKNRIHKFLLFG